MDFFLNLCNAIKVCWNKDLSDSAVLFKKGDGCLTFPIPMNIYFNESSASGNFTIKGH